MLTNGLEWPLGLIFVVSLVALVGSALFGCRLGDRARESTSDSIGTLDAAILGLLALMIGFTFSMALTRYDARRDAVLKEANAIGTTALRARLLPAPFAAQSLKLLRDYTDIRVRMGGRVVSTQDLAAAVARSNDIQEQLWQQVKAVAAINNAMVPTGVYITTLNDMIDAQATRLAAARNRVPPIVIWSLYGVGIIAVGFTGYAVGLEKRRSRIPVFVVCTLAALVILLIQDLDRPTSGLIQVAEQPILDTAASLAGYGPE